MFLPLLYLLYGTIECDMSLSESEPCGMLRVLNAGVVHAHGVSNALSRLVVLPSAGHVAAVAAAVYAEAMAARARAVVREGGAAGG
ncbi:hypothetical protein F5148DRAFT_1218653 [Russula earlei]|uniref:Uncharacterized protein n=1 Tax=Russula earlei TaxID=71964 RepID=A0ACC0U2H5_9AGAM|nr:hypothetical protein F5148DRAFT_1218653 [Russula earlei]